MRFTDLFIRRPVLAIVVNLIIIVAGLASWFSLSVRQYPLSESATVQVSTAYVGASAELVRGFVTTPLERAIGSAEGIDYLESKSLQGFSIINARLKLNVDSTKALADITSKVNQVRNDLPAEAQVPSISVQSADSQFAAAYLSFVSDILSQQEITDYLSRVVQPRLGAVAGVQRIEIFGARTFAMRIWLDTARMAALNVTATQVRQALAANNYLAAIGSSKGALVTTNLNANSDLHTPEEFRRLVVYRQGDTLVRLGDIARVELGAEDYDTVVRYSGRTAVFIGVFPQPNANIIEVIDGVREELGYLQRDLPAGLEASIGYDASAYVSDAIEEVTGTLVETLLIVVAVIFVFLGTIRSVLVPVMAIPVSLIGAVFLMYLFGFTLNLLTLLAIVLSVGLVVDDAIVVVENVERHLREGMSRIDAAMRGARELVGPIIAMTVTLVAVYVPIGLQGGLTGALFREFAFTLAGAVTISGLVALTLSPVMSSRLLQADGGHERGIAGIVNRSFDRLREVYGRALAATLRARPAMYVLWLVIAACTVPMYMFSPKELAPVEDQSVLFGIINTSANATAEQNGIYARATEAAMLETPEAKLSFQFLFPPSIGASLGADGFSGVVVEPWGERTRTVTQILPEVQAKLSRIPGIQMFVTQPPALPGGSNFPVEFVLTSTGDESQLLEAAQRLQQEAATSGLFFFPPIIDMKFDQPQATVVIDRDKVATLGLSLAQVGTDMAVAIGGNFVNRFNMDGRSYKVIPQVQRTDRLNPEQLEQLHIRAPDGRMIPLSAVAHIEQRGAPVGHALAHAGRVAELPREDRPRGAAARIRGGLRGRVAPAAHRGQQVPAVFPHGGAAHLPGAGGAVQFVPRSVRDPVRLRTAGHVRRARVHVPEDARPEHAVLDQRLDHDDEHLRPGGPGDARRAHCQERHPDRGVRQQAAGRGLRQGRGRSRGFDDPPAAGADDLGGHHRRSLPAGAGQWRGRRGAELHRPGAGGRHGHRHAVHAVHRAVHLRADGARSAQGGEEGGRARGGGTRRQRREARTGLRVRISRLKACPGLARTFGEVTSACQDQTIR
jgi:multidrug efflux pump